MPYHTLERQTEEAFVRLLSTMSNYDIEGVQIVRRFDITDIKPPCITVVVDNVTYMPNAADYQTGDCKIRCSVSLITSLYDCTPERHDELMGLIIDHLFIDNLPDALNSIMNGEEWTCQRVDHAFRMCSVSNDHRITEHVMYIRAAPSRRE